MEIACHVAWVRLQLSNFMKITTRINDRITFPLRILIEQTSYGWSTTEPGSELDACPGSNAGPYHAGDPNSMVIEDDLISGCALAIADVRFFILSRSSCDKLITDDSFLIGSTGRRH